MRRRVPIQRSGRRAVAGSKVSSEDTPLDDRPLSIFGSRDGKRIITTLPYEIWVLKTQTLELERTIELPFAEPWPAEADEGMLWIGGSHLHKAHLWNTTSTKVGSKLGGFVDRVALLRPSLLCGAGGQGEVLWDIEQENVIHRRKASEHSVLGLVASADGRAVWIDGSSNAWVIDPDHPSGYMMLRLRRTSDIAVGDEALVRIGMSNHGACILAAMDGAVAWTNRALRIVAERYPVLPAAEARPLDVGGDEKFVYVLRPGGILYRFLLQQREPTEEDPEPELLPEVERCELGRFATCLFAQGDGKLVVGGSHGDGQLGRLWRVDVAALDWQSVRQRERSLATGSEQPSADEPPSRPAFVATRTKVEGVPLAQLAVDEVLEGDRLWAARPHGAWPERAVAPIAHHDIKPADVLLLPAMVRFHEGTARPALLVWPGSANNDAQPPDLDWLVWGDQPRGWMPLHTPAIRGQGWVRRDVFPLEIALPSCPSAPGSRAAIPARWIDEGRFGELVRECKKLLKVLW